VPSEVHVALLRGINVGGKNIIPMAALAQTFERMKFSSVKTFIASGNVIFAAPKQDLRKLEVKIERELVSDFQYDARVVVKSKREIDAIAKGIAKSWPKPTPAIRYYVCFLRHAVDDKKLMARFTAKDGVETLAYVPGALLWGVVKSLGTKSTVSRQLLAKDIYREITIRNLNTTLKIGDLMAAASK
jgi:uncharacterized protein (DUF1697 family)